MGIPNLSLEGQVAIITGGGTGIGRSIALEFEIGRASCRERV